MAAEKRPIARKARMRGGELDGENVLAEEDLLVDVGWELDDDDMECWSFVS
jgi:hypothetical protein